MSDGQQGEPGAADPAADDDFGVLGEPWKPRPSEAPEAPPERATFTWTSGVIAAVVAGIGLYHLAPHLAELAGRPRDWLAGLLAWLPFGDRIGNGAAGWLWEPLWLWIGTTGLRTRALAQAVRSPPSAVLMALIATAAEAGFWLFMGRARVGAAGSAAEQADLVRLLWIEGGVLLALFLLFLPLGRWLKRPASPGDAS